LWRYLQGRHSPVVIGHSPIGALSVFSMLLFLLAQVTSGLFSDDEISVSGPFSHLVSSSWVSLATYYHTRVGKLIILSLIVVHIAAIFFYWHRRRQNLLFPMIFGDKELSQGAPSSRDDRRSRWLAVLVFLACLALISLSVGFQA
jgi:cytochrome b